MRTQPTVLVTGATGLVGFDLLTRALTQRPNLRALVLVRRPERWALLLPRLGALRARVTALQGDLRKPGLGLATPDRVQLRGCVTQVVHAAADVGFARPLAEARASNTQGTARLLELAAECPRLERLLYVSTAFVAGKHCGTILEQDNGPGAGWVNAYEQSKYEAEALVRGSGLPWTIARPGLILCNRAGGPVEQLNAAHHTFRLWRNGLVPMMPGSDSTAVDVVSLEEVGSGLLTLLGHSDAVGATVHLCAGMSAMRLADALALAWEVWRSDPGWRRRNIPLPALVDLATYRLFEATIAVTADPRLRQIVKGLSSFAPGLAYAKCFDTRCKDALLRRVPVEPAALWRTAFERIARNGLTAEAAA